MKHSIRQHWLALSVVILAAAAIAACGQITTSEEASSAGEVRAARPSTARLTQDETCVDGDPACTPTGAHGKHATFDCKVCHAVGGRLAFKAAGPAYGVGQPAPTFNATDKTCSNIGCHAVPAGVYDYFVWDYGLDEAVPMQAPYGGTGQGPTPSWYATASSGGCTSCHNLKFNGVRYAWHSGLHGNYMFGQTTPNMVDVYNQCQTCHPDATGFIQENGTIVDAAITAPSQHANGVLNVQRNTSRGGCSNCH